MSMGLRPLEMAHWLEIDDRRGDELALKAQLLDRVPEVVVATRPAGHAPSEELLGEVVAWLDDHAAGVAVGTPRPGEHPVVSAARLVQEDLCVLVRDDAWRLQAACVCFPSRWSLAAKIGGSLDDIHAPVPGYRDVLARATTGAFDRLRAERSFWRLNWTVLDDPALYQPGSVRDVVPRDVNDLFFRVERQTIRRLAATRAIVFTIRNYVCPLGELAQQPEFLEHLRAAVAGAPADIREYKGWVGLARRLQDAMS